MKSNCNNFDNDNFDTLRYIYIEDLNENKVVSYLHRLLDTNPSEKCIYKINYEYLISIEEHYRNNEEVMKMLNDIKRKISETYLHRCKLKVKFKDTSID